MTIAIASASLEPITTRSGRRKSSTAEPSRRNSGFETTENLCLRVLLPDDLLDLGAGAGRHGRLRDDDLVPVHVLGDRLGDLEHEGQVGRTVLAGRRAHGDEDRQRVLDAGLQVGREPQPLPARSCGSAPRARARRSGPRPLLSSGDLRLVLVDAGDVHAEIGEAGSRDQPHVSGADHANVHSESYPACCLLRTDSRYHSTALASPSLNGTRARKFNSLAAFSTAA